MNRALLAELQRLTCYPSVTILQNTTLSQTSPEPRSLHPDDVTVLIHLADLVDRRLEHDVPDEQRREIITTIMEIIATCANEPPTTALAICVSPQHRAVVRLGNEVRSRVIIDDTFATRDMVADLNRTAAFRVVTVSEGKARLLLGDRTRLVEERGRTWPLHRDDDQSLAQWSRAVSHAVQSAWREFPLPTVVAGSDRSMRELLKLNALEPIGTVSGNHDRTGWADLHRLTWPLVLEWLRGDAERARRSLDAARNANRYAGGLDEVWELAQDGRVELLVVEEDYVVAARISDGRLERAKDSWAPDVVDDAVDELIEIVNKAGGEAVIVPAGDLSHLDRVGAVLRY
jgi:hypothetical protein